MTDTCSFYILMVWRWQPIAVTIMVCALLVIAAAVVGAAYSAQAVTVARAEMQRLHARAVPVPVAANPAQAVGADLPVFDSAVFTAEFNGIAKDVGLPVEELVYALENGAAQPFQRYRITMEVKSGYPEVRKFVAALSNAQPHVVLDSLRCRREDVAAPGLTCQMAFSALFRKVSSA